MGDHIENPLGAAGAVQPCVQVPSAPCQGQGMSAQSQIDSFSQGMARLQKQWPKLTANARVAQLQALVDAQAASNGFPAPMVATPTGLGHRNGELRFTDWSIAINPALVQSNNLTPKQAASLGDTVFHETRHAEQWNLIARRQAATGLTAEQIRGQLGVTKAVAKEAAAHPLATSDPRRACADALHTSVYGANSAARGTTLTNLETESSAYAAANAQLTQAKAEQDHWQSQLDSAKNAYIDRKGMLPGPTRSELDQLAARVQQANTGFNTAQAKTEGLRTTVNSIYRSYQQTYADYRALPEEADAWNSGERAASAIMDSVTPSAKAGH